MTTVCGWRSCIVEIFNHLVEASASICPALNSFWHVWFLWVNDNINDDELGTLHRWAPISREEVDNVFRERQRKVKGTGHDRRWEENRKVTKGSRKCEVTARKKRRLSFLLKKAEAVVGHNLFGANWKNKKCVCYWLCLSGLSTQSTATQPDLFIYSFSHVYSSVMKSLLLPQTSWVALYRDTAWSFSKWVQTAPATKLCECECVCV